MNMSCRCLSKADMAFHTLYNHHLHNNLAFSKHEISQNVVEKFMKEIPYFSYELNLNEHNFYEKALIYPNFILDINKPYNEISSTYSKNCKRNVIKSIANNLRINTTLRKKAFCLLFFN